MPPLAPCGSFACRPANTGLQFLRLDGNKALAEVRFDGPCPCLEVLMLRGCALKAFRLPAGFDALAHLYLNQNELAELELPGDLPGLRTLQVRKNQLTNFPERYLRIAPALEGLYLGNNPLPEELRAKTDSADAQNHLEIIRKHYAQRNSGDLRPNNECKVLFIGNGKAGKSAMVNRIVNDAFDRDWNSTHGITLLQHPHREYVLNFWDFGGQDMYHNTHRLFMQDNAVYLLVWCRETEENPETEHRIRQPDGTYAIRRYKNQSLRYWLEYAHHRGMGSPLHLIQTKVGQDPKISQAHLLADYREAFHPAPTEQAVESAWDNPFDNGYGKLMEAIHQSVAYLKRGNSDLAQSLYDIRAYLRAQQAAGHKTMPYATYEAKARELGVLDPRLELETWLFKTGVVYYRRGKFNDELILDQGWAIQGIYTLFDRSRGVPYEIEKRKGVFSGAFVQDLWKKDYPDQDTHELFIGFMKSCDLCFEVETEEKHPAFRDRLFMAPQLLDEEKPALIEDFWEGRAVRYYRYRHRFLHEGIIHSFIAKTAYLATRREIWRYGIQISEGEGADKQTACLEACDTAIDVRYTPHALPLLAKIRQLLKELLGDGEELDSPDGLHFQALQQVQSLAWEDLAEGPPVEALLLKKGQGPAGAGQSLRFEEDQAMPTTQEDRQAFSRQVAEYTAEMLRASLKPPVSGEEIPRPKRILFLAANPLDTGRLQLDFETKEFKTELALGPAKDQFELLYELALDKSSFLRIKGKQPFILHFSGHGDETGICIQDGQNKIKMIPNEILGPFFKSLSGITELVLLNSCLSSVQAAIIAEFIPYVVGTKEKILDPLAIAFSSGLYNGLGEGLGFKEAIERGRWSVGIEDAAAMESYEAWENGTQIIW